jgi:hypothetical protein
MCNGAERALTAGVIALAASGFLSAPLADWSPNTPLARSLVACDDSDETIDGHRGEGGALRVRSHLDACESSEQAPDRDVSGGHDVTHVACDRTSPTAGRWGPQRMLHPVATKKVVLQI